MNFVMAKRSRKPTTSSSGSRSQANVIANIGANNELSQLQQPVDAQYFTGTQSFRQMTPISQLNLMAQSQQPLQKQQYQQRRQQVQTPQVDQNNLNRIHFVCPSGSKMTTETDSSTIENEEDQGECHRNLPRLRAYNIRLQPNWLPTGWQAAQLHHQQQQQQQQPQPQQPQPQQQQQSLSSANNFNHHLEPEFALSMTSINVENPSPDEVLYVRSTMPRWSAPGVRKFIEQHRDIAQYSRRFGDGEVDGKSLLLMVDDEDNIRKLEPIFKLGGAYKIDAALKKYRINTDQSS